MRKDRRNRRRFPQSLYRPSSPFLHVTEGRRRDATGATGVTPTIRLVEPTLAVVESESAIEIQADTQPLRPDSAPLSPFLSQVYGKVLLSVDNGESHR